MKRRMLFVVMCLFLSSCHPLIPHYYGFYFQNNSDEDIFFIMDFDPSDGIISRDHSGIVKSGSLRKNDKSERHCFEEFVKDSAAFYIGHLEKMLTDDAGRIVVNESAFFAKMTLALEDFFDPTHKTPYHTVFFPPEPDSAIKVYYYE